MWVGQYHFEEYELPTRIDQVRHGLPATMTDGPTAFEFNADDASVTMFFAGFDDFGLGNSIAKAYVHGLYLSANENHCQLSIHAFLT